jgi:hypothetical protein
MLGCCVLGLLGAMTDAVVQKQTNKTRAPSVAVRAMPSIAVDVVTVFQYYVCPPVHLLSHYYKQSLRATLHAKCLYCSC